MGDVAADVAQLSVARYNKYYNLAYIYIYGALPPLI